EPELRDRALAQSSRVCPAAAAHLPRPRHGGRAGATAGRGLVEAGGRRPAARPVGPWPATSQRPRTPHMHPSPPRPTLTRWQLNRNEPLLACLKRRQTPRWRADSSQKGEMIVKPGLFTGIVLVAAAAISSVIYSTLLPAYIKAGGPLVIVLMTLSILV